MGLKKGYCPFCKVSDNRNRVIEVNPEAKIFYCPNCLHALDPRVAIDDYHNFIERLTFRADTTLRRFSEFSSSYQQYADILEIEPNNFDARIGRIIALLYLSTIRVSQIANAMIIFKNEKTKYYHKSEQYDKLFSYVITINHILDEYHHRLFRRLTLKRRFYDAECIMIYFQRTKEIVDFKQELLLELEYLSEKVSDPKKVEQVVEKINANLAHIHSENKNEYLSAEGYRYTFVDFNQNGVPFFARSEKKEAKNIYRIRYSTLDSSEKGKKVILSDIIFKDRTKINHFLKIILPIYIISFGLAICLAAIGVYHAIKQDFDLWYVFIIVAGVFFVIGLAFGISRLVLIQKSKTKN